MVSCAEDEGVLSPEEAALMEQAAAEIESGKADTDGCSGAVVPDRGDFGKRIALTFDDGPHLTNTPNVLDILARHHAKGTFFVLGKNVSSAGAKALLRRMQAEGHLVGNHSYDHANLATVSSGRLVDEIEDTRAALNSVGIRPSFFRFPYGSATCSAVSTVRSYGYKVAGWHIDSADWCYAAGQGYCSPSTFRYVDDALRHDIVGYVVKQAKARGGGVLLFHDVHSYTVSKLDEILTRLEQEGFSFVRLDDASVFPRLNGGSSAPTPFIGSPCTDDAQCAFTVQGVRAYCLDFTPQGERKEYGFCTVPCAGYCADKAGFAETFCTSLDGGQGGVCVAKAASENSNCAGIPGTEPETVSRFVGGTGAAPATAVACVPKE